MAARSSFTPRAPFVLLLALFAPVLIEAGSAKIWIGYSKEYLDFLENAEVISIEEVGTGVNKPKRLTLRQGERVLQGLWKPIRRGPKESGWESYETEVAAYQIDRMLGLDMVPPTVVKEIDGQEGSLQLWVDGCRLFKDIDDVAPETESWQRQISQMWVFDALIGNWDRGSRNYMVDDEWNIVLIDHSQAFSGAHYLDEQMDQVPSRFDRKQIERVRHWDSEYLSFRFGRLLMRPQVDAVIIRRDALLRYVEDLAKKRGDDAVWFEN